MFYRNTEATKSVVSALISALICRIGLTGVGGNLRRREWTGNVHQIVCRKEMHTQQRVVRDRECNAGVQQYASRIGVFAPTIERRVDKGCIRDAIAKLHAALGDVALQSEAARHALSGHEVAIDHGYRGNAHDAASRVSPQ